MTGAERYGDGDQPVGEHRTALPWERLSHELGALSARMGHVDHFLIVWGFQSTMRKSTGLGGSGRGSAAVIVAYCLKITNIDPIYYNLLFERF